MHPRAEAAWTRLKGEMALLAPAGSSSTPQNDKLKGVPRQRGGRTVVVKPTSTEIDPRLGPAMGQNWIGKLPTIWQQLGLSRLWVDNLEPMPISAVPPQIRRSLYQQNSRRIGLWPLNDMWYPIAENANTLNDVRWAVTKPPVAVAGNTPNSAIMSPRSQFRQAWRVPRYSTLPDSTVPTSGPIPPGGGNAP